MALGMREQNPDRPGTILRNTLVCCGMLVIGVAGPSAAPGLVRSSGWDGDQLPAAVRPPTARSGTAGHAAPRTRQPVAGDRFTATNGGATYDDHLLHVTWLADANYAARQRFGLPVNTSGSMDYATALKWVAALNAEDGGKGYLGHHTWTLPTTPHRDRTCSTIGPQPHRNSFGYNCTGSALGHLYYQTLGLLQPHTAVPIPSNRVGAFKDFQPYLYWSATPTGTHASGYHTFSFATGWQGQNVAAHNMYVLPMITGNPFHASPSGRHLEPVDHGQAVYDPRTRITWLADADLAAHQTFHVENIDRDGSMTWDTAHAFVQAMNADRGTGYLGQSHWALPPATLARTGTKPCGGFECRDSALGELYYDQFGFRQGQPVVAAPHVAVGPFSDLQPYLYWSCEGGAKAVRTQTCTGVPATNYGWSFSFGNGFEGTDRQDNDLYVMVYYPDTE